MRTIAKLARRLNWPQDPNGARPMFFLMSDPARLPDPAAVLRHLPKGAAVILRHSDETALTALARRILPQAERLGLKVLLSNAVRLACRLGCAGVHLSEAQARKGPLRLRPLKPGFIITVAAHDRRGLWRAERAGAHLVFLSPVFATKSHPDARALGPLRFAALARTTPLPVVALGGVTPNRAKRLALGPARGLAAIEAWAE